MVRSALDLLGRSHAAMLFDMDGTLLNSAVVTDRVWGAWALRHDLDEQMVLAQVHGTRAVDALRRIGVPGLEIEVEADALSHAEMLDMDGIRPIQGAAGFLTALPPNRWAIVTSSTRELALRRLRAAGLPVPAVLVTAESMSRGKPDPEGYLAAAGALKVPIEQCLVFEDSSVGVAAGVASGAEVIVIGETQVTDRPAIRDFMELVRIDRAGIWTSFSS